MKGTITAIVRRTETQAGGFGFLQDEEGNERFFHARNVRGVYTNKFEQLSEGWVVDFTPVEIPGKGLRAEAIEVL